MSGAGAVSADRLTSELTLEQRRRMGACVRCRVGFYSLTDHAAMKTRCRRLTRRALSAIAYVCADLEGQLEPARANAAVLRLVAVAEEAL